jgi:hypothetical protein
VVNSGKRTENYKLPACYYTRKKFDDTGFHEFAKRL